MTGSHAIVVILCLLAIANTASASRQRITLAPEPGVYSEADVEKEVLFGREVAAIILADRKLDADDERHPAHDPRYAGIKGLPATESLATTLDRVLPCWNDIIAPELRAGKNVLIAAHGNSLRALVKMLDNVSDDEITGFNIPTGIPLAYELDGNLQPVSSEFLGDADAIAKAAAAVAAQGKSA